MKIVLSLIYLLFLLTLNGAETKKDIYIIVTGFYNPSIDVTFKQSIFESDVFCFPVTYKSDIYNEEAVKKAFEKYVLAKDEEGKVSNIKVEVFTDQKEAALTYQSYLTSSEKKYKRVAFSRAHIDKARDKMEQAKRVAESVQAAKKAESEKAIDDIYE